MDVRDTGPDPSELRDFWDQFVLGGSTESGGLDAESDATVRQLHRLHRPESPDPSFMARLEESLMQTTTYAPTTRPVPFPNPNGRPLSSSPASSAGASGLSGGRIRAALSQFATAVLLAVTVVSVLAFLFGMQRVPAFVAAAWDLVSQTEEEASVPFYRGDAARTGVNPDPGPEGVPEVLWSYETGPTGYSSPVFAGGLVYSLTDDGDLVALDAGIGQERWRFESGMPETWTPGPAVVDGVVYAGMPDEYFYARDSATGEEQWRFDTGLPSCASPVVVEGIVYGGAGCSSLGGIVFALDAATGQQIWSVATEGGRVASPAFAGGMLYLAAGGDAKSFNASTSLLALDAATGEEQWRFDTGGGIWSSPAVVGETVYVSSTSGLFAVNATSGDSLWEVQESITGRIWGAPAVMDGLVYVASEDQYLYAFDASTGEERWRFDYLATINDDADPTVAGGVVYVGNSKGLLFAVDAATGEERWRIDLDGVFSSGPTIIDGVIYLGLHPGSSGAIVALAEPAAA